MDHYSYASFVIYNLLFFNIHQVFIKRINSNSKAIYNVTKDID